MKYEVRCECGKVHKVSGSDAGTSVPCECGRKVEVPPLHTLRAAAGEAALSPVVRIQSLLYEGRLPGTRDCAGYGRETDGSSQVSVVCERVITTSGASIGEVLGGWLLLGIPWLLVLANRSTPQGTEVAFLLPL